MMLLGVDSQSGVLGAPGQGCEWVEGGSWASPLAMGLDAVG